MIDKTAIGAALFVFLLSSYASPIPKHRFVDETGAPAQIVNPKDVAVDSSGNVYVSSYKSPGDTSKIIKIDHRGNVSTWAGNEVGFADGTGTQARFKYPRKLAVDSLDNVYVIDQMNSRIRRIDVAGNVTTLEAVITFSLGNGVALDGTGNIYVADTSHHQILRINEALEVNIIAGSGERGFRDGAGPMAQFFEPDGIAVDSVGNVFVADKFNNSIRKIDLSGNVTTLAGGDRGFADGLRSAAKFHSPQDVAVDRTGVVYVADPLNDRIRKIDAMGNVTTLAGGVTGYADGVGTAAQFDHPVGLTVDSAGNVYVADSGNNRVRKIDPTGNVTTLAGGDVVEVIDVDIFDAARNGDAQTVQDLLDGGADINARSEYGEGTALIVAVLGRHPEVVRVLLDRGADPNIRLQGFVTALDLAMISGMEDIIEMLKAVNADETHPLEGDSIEARYLKTAIEYEPDPVLKHQWEHWEPLEEVYQRGRMICERLREGADQSDLIANLGLFFGRDFATGLVVAAKKVICPGRGAE